MTRAARTILAAWSGLAYLVTVAILFALVPPAALAQTTSGTIDPSVAFGAVPGAVKGVAVLTGLMMLIRGDLHWGGKAIDVPWLTAAVDRVEVWAAAKLGTTQGRLVFWTIVVLSAGVGALGAVSSPISWTAVIAGAWAGIQTAAVAGMVNSGARQYAPPADPSTTSGPVEDAGDVGDPPDAPSSPPLGTAAPASSTGPGTSSGPVR